MSNFEDWKAAKASYELYERAYRTAQEAVIEASRKRSDAWEELVQAAQKLSHNETMQAADYQFGQTNTSGIRESKS